MQIAQQGTNDDGRVGVVQTKVISVEAIQAARAKRSRRIAPNLARRSIHFGCDNELDVKQATRRKQGGNVAGKKTSPIAATASYVLSSNFQVAKNLLWAYNRRCRNTLAISSIFNQSGNFN